MACSFVVQVGSPTVQALATQSRPGGQSATTSHWFGERQRPIAPHCRPAAQSRSSMHCRRHADTRAGTEIRWVFRTVLIINACARGEAYVGSAAFFRRPAVGVARASAAVYAAALGTTYLAHRTCAVSIVRAARQLNANAVVAERIKFADALRRRGRARHRSALAIRGAAFSERTRPIKIARRTGVTQGRNADAGDAACASRAQPQRP